MLSHALPSARAMVALRPMLVRQTAAVAVLRTSSGRRSYATGIHGASEECYEGYGAYEQHSTMQAAAAAPASSMGCPTAAPRASPMSCMNRNARKPTPANHGARPNSNYNRKSSSPEFGSWRHPGLKPGQTPPPRPQPGTPMTIATVGVGAFPTQAQKPAATKQAASKQ